MLTFLRKIRKTLIESNSFQKYLLYAIGEIALVVIGILIALQVNNWNVWREERVKEHKVLEGMQNTLQINLDQLSYHIKFIKRYNNSGKLILDLLKERKLGSDTLYRHFHYSLVNGSSDVWLSDVGYEYLKLTNAEIIQNEELRKSLVGLFEGPYKYMFQELRWGLKDDPETHPWVDENLKRNQNVGLEPYDVRDLYDSRVFESLISKAIAQRSYILNILELSKEETQKVLEMVRDELKKE